MVCPLCQHGGTVALSVDGLVYHDCPGCGLIYLDPRHHPSREAERAHYLTHENDAGDPRYRAFLDRLATPLGAKLAVGARGLDYGAGPGPTLHRMLTERGFPTAAYDPFFPASSTPTELGTPSGMFDFLTCSETVEHFHHPRREFERFDAMLRPGGWLGLMTTLWLDDAPLTSGGARENALSFRGWWYRRDPTHVSFYRPRTLGWLADRFGWLLERPSPTVALFQKSGAPAEASR